MYALLLDCVPGVATEDWQPEPWPVAAMHLGPGAIVWSALLTPEGAEEIRAVDLP